MILNESLLKDFVESEKKIDNYTLIINKKGSDDYASLFIYNLICVKQTDNSGLLTINSFSQIVNSLIS